MKSLKEAWKEIWSLKELKSIIQTWIAGLPFDVVLASKFAEVTGGDWSTGALVALGSALFRSFIKTIWTIVSKQLSTK